MIARDFLLEIANYALRKLAQEALDVARNLPRGEPLELIHKTRQYPPKGHHFRSQPDPHPERQRGYDSTAPRLLFSLHG